MTPNDLQSIPSSVALSIVPLRTSDTLSARPPLFLVPGAAFIANTFSNLTKYLSADQPVYSFQVIGQTGYISRWRRLEDIAAECIDLIRSVRPHGPYWLGGYSMGAYVAYEIARSLQAQPESIESLINFDMPAPARLLRLKVRSVRWLAHILRWSPAYQLDLNFRLHRAINYYFWLPSRHKTRWLLDNLRAYVRGALPVPISPPMAPAGVDPNFVLRNIQLSRSYLPGRYAGDMLVYKSTRGLQHNPEVRDLAMRWGRLVSGRVETFVVDAEHITLIRRPQIEIIAADLDQRLARLDTAR
jgi:thioesterase domain-containing protein